MKYQHRVLGMLSLLAVITSVDRVCIAVAGPRRVLTRIVLWWSAFTSLTGPLAALSPSYAGILRQRPNPCAVCLDTGRSRAGAVRWLKIDPTHQVFETRRSLAA